MWRKGREVRKDMANCWACVEIGEALCIGCGPRGEGLHHLGFDVKNIEEQIKYLEELGISILQYGEL